MFDRKIALVTGASSFVGEATALLLAENGYTVYCISRSTEMIDHLKLVGIYVRKMDVLENESMEKVINEIIDLEGRIDVVINNASFGAFDPDCVQKTCHQFKVNILGLASLYRLVLPCMQQQHSGKIVNVTATTRKMTPFFNRNSDSNLFPLKSLVSNVSLCTKQYGVDFIIIETDGVKTAWTDITVSQREEMTRHKEFRELNDQRDHIDTGLHYYTEPIEIAEMILAIIGAYSKTN